MNNQTDFVSYIKKHEKVCDCTHSIHPARFLFESKLGCIKDILYYIETKEQFKEFFPFGILHTIKNTDDMTKINYFFNFRDNIFQKPECKTKEENLRMDWIYTEIDNFNDVHEILNWSAESFLFNFVCYIFERYTLKIRKSIFDNVCRYINYASLGYTNCHYGLFGKPGNPSIYKRFHEFEIWKKAEGDEEENKKEMIDMLTSYLPRFVKTGGIYELDMRNEWWQDFLKENCSALYPKIDWIRFQTPEEDLFTKMARD
jgi:hypothetical protein